MSTAALTRDVATRHGIYPAGLPVTVIDTPRRGRRRLCLDPHGIHLTHRCHHVTVPARWVTRLSALDPTPMAGVQVTELVHETIGTWSRMSAA